MNILSAFRLTVNSDSVARQLEATNIMAEEMMQTQNATLQSQEEILRTGNLLKQTLQESTTGESLGIKCTCMQWGFSERWKVGISP